MGKQDMPVVCLFGWIDRKSMSEGINTIMAVSQPASLKCGELDRTCSFSVFCRWIMSNIDLTLLFVCLDFECFVVEEVVAG